MKMLGVALASSIHFVFRFLIIFACAKLDKDLKKSFIPIFHEDSFKDLGYVLEIGWQSFLLKVMGWWAFDVFTQFAAFSNNLDWTGAQTILRNIGLFTYMIPVGFSQSATFLVGKYLGKNRADLA